MTDVAGDIATVTLAGRSTRVRLVRLWEVEEPTFRARVADVFQSVWPDRRGECVAIRRGAHTPERKPTPLVLVRADGPPTGILEVLGYVIVYPSSAARRPPSGGNTGECSNCTLNSVLVPAELRGHGVGAALVKLAARCAVRDLGFECVTAWCQPRLVPFYETCGFVYEPPGRAAGAATPKEARWANLLLPGDGNRAGAPVGKSKRSERDSSSEDDEDVLDECMRMFVQNPETDLPSVS